MLLRDGKHEEKWEHLFWTSIRRSARCVPPARVREMTFIVTHNINISGPQRKDEEFLWSTEPRRIVYLGVSRPGAPHRLLRKM